MPNESYPNGMRLSRENVFSGATRLYTVVAGGDKELVLEHLNGPLQGDRCTVSIKQAGRDYREAGEKR